MPSSPAMRFSPGREQRVGENHKRGCILEGSFLFKEKDDDLALFNEMQSRERENFLLQSTDDFEDTFSTKLKHLSDVKLGVLIPARGESSELLNVDGEKNDYDWLLTPPDTPLFPSLDDEPPTVSAVTRGRPRSQPISMSSSSTMERSHRSSRGSASPNRLSPSPRSGSSSMSQSRGRLLSSPTSSQWPATPSRLASPPPSKASTSASRSSTPTPRRMSTGSGVRGTSPIRTNRGNSASPKIRAWQSNIPGFSSEAPPNLRTSLADRPASYVRGSSPASRNSRVSGSQFGRKSMSPTASRSGSSHGQDGDHIGSHSRGSVDSGGDDDLDSLQSYHVGSLDRLAYKRIGPLQTNKAPAFSKKSTKVFSPSSAPKRSFDPVLRQMDHRKSPQNMFRPLLSSVPNTTFYAGKASSAHHSLISRNSSVTTSSNTSSDQGTTFALDTEGSDHWPEDVPTESGKGLYPDAQEEVFAFDKMDAQNKTVGHDVHEDSVHHLQLGNFDRDTAVEHEAGVSEFIHQDIDGELSSTSENLCVRADFSEVDSLESTKVCSRCGCRYHFVDTVERDGDLCPDCSRQDNLMAATHQAGMVAATVISEQYEVLDEPEPIIAVPELQLQVAEKEARNSQHEENIKQGQTSYDERGSIYSYESSVASSMVDAPQETLQLSAGYSLPISETDNQHLTRSNGYPSLMADLSEVSGISILLKRSSSDKGHVVQGRSFVASTITYDDLLYARDSVRSLRSSLGHGSTSASSSFDFSSVRSVETRIQRQLSVKKGDMEVSRDDIQTRPRSASSSISGTLNQRYRVTNKPEDAIEPFSGDMKLDGAAETLVASHTQTITSEDKDMDACSMSIVDEIIPEETSVEGNESMEISALDASHCIVGSIQVEDKEVASMPDHAKTPSSDNEKDFLENVVSPLDEAASTIDNHSIDVTEASTHMDLVSISEIQMENCSQSDPGSDNDDISGSLKSIINEIQDKSLLSPADKDMAASVLVDNSSDNVHGVQEESTVMVDSQVGSNARSLSLEEATDTILFCSSIVNDLAYHAATIAVEKETSVQLEGSKPTVAILGKSNADRRDPHGRTAGKRASKSKSLKVRQQMDTDVKSPSYKTENDENANEGTVRNVGLPNKMDGGKPPPKLESKCNCTIM